MSCLLYGRWLLLAARRLTGLAGDVFVEDFQHVVELHMLTVFS